MGLGQAILFGMLAVTVVAQIYLGWRISNLARAKFPDVWAEIVADRQLMLFHHGAAFLRRHGDLAAHDPNLKRLVWFYRATQPAGGLIFASLVVASIMKW